MLAAWKERLRTDRLGGAGQSADVFMARTCQVQERSSSWSSWRLRRHATAASCMQTARLASSVH